MTGAAVFRTGAIAFAGCLALWSQMPGRGRAGRSGAPAEPEPVAFGDTAGWNSLFDGQGLRGWDGNLDIWHVEGGAIVADSTCERPAGTSDLVWQGGEPGDFELKAEIKIEGAGVRGAIQYRSFVRPPGARGGSVSGRGPGSGARAGPGGRAGAREGMGTCPSGQPRGTPPDPAANARWNLGGPQIDFDGGNRYGGRYAEGGTERGLIVGRGQVVQASGGRKPRLIATLATDSDLAGHFKVNDWNQVQIIARGAELIHIVNGQVTAVLIDDDPAGLRKSGLVGLKIEGLGRVSFRNLWMNAAP